jgi:hypothetical protein
MAGSGHWNLTMKTKLLLVLPLCAIILAGCVAAGGVNYHFPVSPRPADRCDPATKNCPPPAERARP